jgi:hypothetical protein
MDTGYRRLLDFLRETFASRDPEQARRRQLPTRNGFVRRSRPMVVGSPWPE